MTDDGLRPVADRPGPCYVVTWPGWDAEELIAHHATHAGAIDEAAEVLERLVEDASDFGGLLDADELLNLAATIRIERGAERCWEASCSSCDEPVAEYSHHTGRAAAVEYLADAEWLLLADGAVLCSSCKHRADDPDVEPDRRPGPGQQALL